MLKSTIIAFRAAITISAVTFSAGLLTKATAQTTEDSASVSEFVEAYQRAFNKHDPAALTAFFTEDAELLMFNLPEIHGRQAIENWWRDYWLSKFNKQEAGRKGTFDLESVRFLTSDVALANIETTTGGRDSLGVELDSRKARGTWLLNRQDKNWLITTMCGMPTEKDSVALGSSLETSKSLRPHIRAFVDAYEDAFNSHDASAVSAFFRSDADIIVRNGPVIHSTRAIQEWWSDYFSKPRDYRALFVIEGIKTISEDVVQLNGIATGALPGTEDESQPVRQAGWMWILAREAGEWQIAALRVLPGKDDRIFRR